MRFLICSHLQTSKQITSQSVSQRVLPKWLYWGTMKKDSFTEKNEKIGFSQFVHAVFVSLITRFGCEIEGGVWSTFLYHSSFRTCTQNPRFFTRSTWVAKMPKNRQNRKSGHFRHVTIDLQRQTKWKCQLGKVLRFAGTSYMPNFIKIVRAIFEIVLRIGFFCMLDNWTNLARAGPNPCSLNSTY